LQNLMCMLGTRNEYVGASCPVMLSALKQRIWHAGHAAARAMGSHYSYIFNGCAPCTVLLRWVRLQAKCSVNSHGQPSELSGYGHQGLWRCAGSLGHRVGSQDTTHLHVSEIRISIYEPLQASAHGRLAMSEEDRLSWPIWQCTTCLLFLG